MLKILINCIPQKSSEKHIRQAELLTTFVRTLSTTALSRKKKKVRKKKTAQPVLQHRLDNEPSTKNRTISTFQFEMKHVCTEPLCWHCCQRATLPGVSALLSQQKYDTRCVCKRRQVGASSFLRAANRPNLMPGLQTACTLHALSRGAGTHFAVREQLSAGERAEVNCSVGAARRRPS